MIHNIIITKFETAVTQKFLYCKFAARICHKINGYVKFSLKIYVRKVAVFLFVN